MTTIKSFGCLEGVHHLVGMAEIAEMLGVSRQRVAQIVASYEDFPAPEAELAAGRIWARTAIEGWIARHPERGRPKEVRRRRFFGWIPTFHRFTGGARTAIVKAQEEARLLCHESVGVEHLLLGLVAVGEGVAYEVLANMDVGLDPLRDRIIEITQRGEEPPVGRLPFTPQAKETLERALRRALALGHDYVGSEHLLLTIVEGEESTAVRALHALRVDPKDVKEAVEARIETLDPRRYLGRRARAVAKGGLSLAEAGPSVAELARRVDELAAQVADILNRLEGRGEETR